jgi:hypothetical protein
MGASPNDGQTISPNARSAPSISSPTSLSSSISPSCYSSEDTETAFLQLFDAQEQVHILTKQLASAQREIQVLEGQLELFSGLDDGPHVPPPTRNTSVMTPASADLRTTSHQRQIYPEQSQSPLRSRLHTPRKGRVADVGLGGFPLHSTPIHPFESTPSAKEKGKGRDRIADTGAEPPSSSFIALILQNYGLHSFLDPVLLIVKLIPDEQQPKELVRLGIPTGVVSELLTAITMDEVHMD